ncbi:MAG TPA: hypothetical protein VGS01_07445 [Candidatus Limnocylindria bacterium]|jgi:hypothetical protein|nr:hypothetical protein [Candidatus Limnocylindria bacterium]
MRTTEQGPAAEERLQERQLIAGRYRLTARHREDETTEVWRAFDEPGHQVVILEILRDPRPASRERFVTEARHIAMQPPTVMRVTGIHDDADGTFIVYEDLVQQPVVLDAHKPAVDERVAPPRAPELPTVVSPTVAAQMVAAPTVEPVAAIVPPPMIAPVADVFAPEAPSPALSGDPPIEHGLTGLIDVLRLHDPALIDMRLLRESASEVAAAARSRIEDRHLEEVRLATIVTQARVLLDRVVAEARALLVGVDPSVPSSAFERARVVAERLTSVRPHLRVPTLPHLSLPRLSLPAPRVSRSQVKSPRVDAVARPTPAPRAPRRARRPSLHVRWGRVLSGGLSVGVLAVVALTIPPELATNLAMRLESEVSSKLNEALQPAPPAAPPALTRATFELPPLSAYAATFETQGAYPTARPNGTVEWVVALRNTGSAGWYRGIDGAQASLALADGSNAAVQSTPYVGPGQVGWFVVHFRASADPGAYRLFLTPRIDGRGPLPDLGIFAAVTVSKGP